MSPEEKEAIIDELLITKRKGHKLEITLLFKGNEDEAANVKKNNTKLSNKIDGLLSILMKDWIGSSEVTVSSLKKSNQQLQKTIRDIKNDVEVEKNVVKALSYLDDAIKTAVALLV